MSNCRNGLKAGAINDFWFGKEKYQKGKRTSKMSAGLKWVID